MGKTLKIVSYGGVNYYVRWLDGLKYEVLIAYKGGIYAHQLQLRKPLKAERRNSIEERHKGATDELETAAILLIDNLKKEFSTKKVVAKKIKQIYVKTTKIIGNVRKSIRVS